MEFFTAQIRNPHTRAAYGAAVTRFFTWCDATSTRCNAGIAPPRSSSIRRLFDWLVIGQVVPANPAASVRGPTHVVRTGKTPVLQPADFRQHFKQLALNARLKNVQLLNRAVEAYEREQGREENGH